MRVRVRLLGGFDVAVDGRQVPDAGWHRRSASGLVKLLALQPDRRLLRDQVIDALWPELLLDEAGPRLHVAAHHARTTLGSREAIVLARGTVSLLPDARVTVDAAEFERAADAARADGDPQAATEALTLYGGDLLPDDLYEEWTEEPRARLRLRLRHLELLRAAGRFEELVAADPLDEEAHLLLVGELIGRGQAAPALRALDRLTEIFRRELGTDPGAAATALRRRAEALAVVPVVPEQRAAPGSAPAGRARPPLPAPRTRLIGRDRDLGEPGLERLARGYRMVPLRLLGRTRGLDDEARALTEAGCGNDYDRYICIWAASLLALVDRDGPRLSSLMDAQLGDLMTTGLHENWLTMYWGALGQVCNGADCLPQLRRARRRAEVEGRNADADCVLALAYAAACRDDWERATELLGAAAAELRRDTAGYIHLTLLKEQLVRPRLEPASFETATALGRRLDLAGLLVDL